MYLTTFLALCISLLLFFIITLYLFPLKVTVSFTSEQQPHVHIIMSWLSPFIKGHITKHNDHIILTISLFNKIVLTKDLTHNKVINSKFKGKNYRDYIALARSIKVENAKLNASYGFINPATTGILCGVIDFVSQYINIDELYNNADFFTVHDYFYINAEAKVNVAISIIRILIRKIPYLDTRILVRHR